MWDARLPIQAAACETARASTPTGRVTTKRVPPSVGKSAQICPLMQLDDLPADIQPQSQSLRGIVRSGLKEALEDPIACLDGDPDAMVADGELEVGAGCESVTTTGSPGWLCLMALSRRSASTSPNRNGSIQAFSAAGASVIRCR